LTLECFSSGSTAQETDSNTFSDRPASEWTWHDYEDYIRQIFAPFNDVDPADILALYPAPPSSVRHHPPSFPVNRSAPTPERSITTAVSDMRAVCPVDEVAKVAAHYASSPVYRYVATFCPGSDDTMEINGNHSSTLDSAASVLNKIYAYSGIDVDAFFGVLSDDLGSRKFSENMRNTVFSFVRGEIPQLSASAVPSSAGGVRRRDAPISVTVQNETTTMDWRTFLEAQYEISTTIWSRTQPRLASNECTYWRENGFYPTYTWMN